MISGGTRSGQMLAHVSDQLLRERRNDTLGQSFGNGLIVCGRNLIGQCFGYVLVQMLVVDEPVKTRNDVCGRCSPRRMLRRFAC